MGGLVVDLWHYHKIGQRICCLNRPQGEDNFVNHLSRAKHLEGAGDCANLAGSCNASYVPSFILTIDPRCRISPGPSFCLASPLRTTGDCCSWVGFGNAHNREQQKLHAEEPVSTISHCSSRQHSWRNLAHLVEHTMSPFSDHLMAALARLCCMRAHVVGAAQGKRGRKHPRPQQNRTKESRTHNSAAEDSPGMLGTSHERGRGFSVLGECRDSTRRMERGSISFKSGILEARNSPRQPPKPDHTCTCSCDVPALVLRAQLKGTKHQSNEPGGCMAETRVTSNFKENL